jgi:hypothetical protein
MKVGKLVIEEAKNIDNILASHPQFRDFCDFSHSTKKFLHKLENCSSIEGFHIGNITYIKGFDDMLQVSKDGLCYKGHPSSAIFIENSVLVNTFTTIKPNLIDALPMSLKLKSYKGFDGTPRLQGYNLQGIILPKAAVKGISIRNHEDIRREHLLRLLQKYVKVHGDKSVRVDLVQLLNDFFGK